LTDDIPKISDHWKTLDLKFDALYTGYLGSAEQVQIVSDLFDRFGSADNFIVVDPVLGDGGSLYAGITDELN
jgi:pyridoxine kinase